MLWQVLFWLVMALLAVIVLCLILPVHILLTWQSDPQRASVLLRPFGGVCPAIRVYDSTRKAKPEKPPKPDRKRGRAGCGKPRGNMFSEGAVLLRRVLGAFRIDALDVDAEFGLGDPAETGQLYGQLCPLIYGLPLPVQIRPNFGAACLHGSAMAELRVVPVAVAWPFARFGWRVFGPV